MPDVRVRIAEFKSSADGAKVFYDIIAEGNSKATKVEPGKVRSSVTLYYLNFKQVMKRYSRTI